MKAAAVIVTIHTQAAIDEIVQIVRALRPDILIVSRARDATHARHLYAIGVTDAVPETIEASLQLSEAALVGLGLPAGPVIASIHEKRDEFRHELQEAAGHAGRTETRSIRAKTLRRIVGVRTLRVRHPNVSRETSRCSVLILTALIPAACPALLDPCALCIETGGNVRSLQGPGLVVEIGRVVASHARLPSVTLTRVAV